MSLKQKVHTHCLQLLSDKIVALQNILQELSEGTKENSKSSAGDKHETELAMIQIEQEAISKQLNEVLDQKAMFDKINIDFDSQQIIKGSLVKTNKGYLFLSIALGKVTVDDTLIMVISPQSPLGIKLMGLNVNGSIQMNGMGYFVETIQ